MLSTFGINLSVLHENRESDSTIVLGKTRLEINCLNRLV